MIKFRQMKLDVALNFMAKRYRFLKEKIDKNHGVANMHHCKNEASAIRTIVAAVMVFDTIGLAHNIHDEVAAIERLTQTKEDKTNAKKIDLQNETLPDIR